MKRFTLGLFVLGIAHAAPAKVAYDNLFRAKASWTLPCIETRDQVSHSLGDLVCTIDASSRDGNAKRAHLTCSGTAEYESDLGRTFVSNTDALWGPADQDPLVEIVKTQPLLAAHPKAGVRRQYDGDRSSCCTTATAPCKPCPAEYSGTEYTTAPLDKSWCVRSRVWGLGGATSTTVVCLAADGALTGIGSYRSESDTRVLRCGATIDPTP